MRTNRTFLVVSALVWIFHNAHTAQASHPPHRLVAHEWGTFTVLQDESGRSIPGVNINEEALPEFVHRLADGLAPEPQELGPLLNLAPYGARFLRSKGVPRFYPSVTMRMETPIIYLYPPAGVDLPLELDLEIDFRAGWISEWYPNASIEAPGFHPGPNETIAGRLSPETTGRIRWTGLQVGGPERPVPFTQEHVWLAPRRVPAATVATADGEAERYLFYRGVANLDAPLQTRRAPAGRLEIRPSTARGVFGLDPAPHIEAMWLADIRPDGAVAFRELGPITPEAWSAGVSTKAEFEPGTHAAIRRAQLRASMRRAVIEAGLHEPEADALLDTWEASYFKSPGLRLFFLLPRAWTDAVLPLRLSRPAEVVRVMIGRIELVTPEQRKLLSQIAAAELCDVNWFSEPWSRIPEEQQGEARRALLEGRHSLEDYGIRMPDHYRWYLALGRFRDALVLDALDRGKMDGLRGFADAYGLRYFRPSNGE